MDAWWLVPMAYLTGSIQWGLIVVMLVQRVDVRSYGSGKTGVTNVLRTAGKGPALLVLLGDASKGMAVVLAARLLTDNASLHATVAGTVIAGHVWPVLAGFRGGRGIATGAAAAATLAPVVGLISVAVFTLAVVFTRYVSLGSVLAVGSVMAFFAVALAAEHYPMPYFLFSVTAGSLVVFMHRDNIRLLLRGTERRLGDRA
jgi:glycerol-3-phosphate acyltransferase PlsY